MQIKKENVPSGIVIWQGKNTEVAQGGFTLDDAAFTTENEVIPAGTPIGFNESSRVAKVAKLAVAQAVATDAATDIKIKKNSLIKVGMTIKSGASEGKEITAIDKTNADYDLVSVEATLGVAIATGDAIFVDDAGYTGVKGLLYEDAIIDSNGTTDVAVVLRGTVYANRITPVPATIQAKLPLIIFSQSF